MKEKLRENAKERKKGGKVEEIKKKKRVKVDKLFSFAKSISLCIF